MTKRIAKRGTAQRPHRLAPMTTLMRFYFDAWIGRPKLFGDTSDEHYFFLFVKACLHGGAANRDGHWVRKQLEKEGNIPQPCVDKAAEWFDICAGYDASARYFRGSQSPHQFDTRPKDRRLWKVKLKEADERASH